MPDPQSGNIQTTPLSDVLEQLRQHKATGTLTVRNSAAEKCVYMKTGQIVFASSTAVQDRLGEVLVRNGKITRENLDHALSILRKNAGFKKLGAIMVENGLVSPKDLFAGLKIQVKEIIFSLFLLTEGEYGFVDRLPSDIIQLQINFQELIAEIIQRMRQDA